MACPVCGEHCRCSEPNAYVSGVSGEESLIDPETDDASEQRFTASLETSATSGLQSGGLDDGPVSGFSPVQERGILGASCATTKEWDSSLLDLTSVPQAPGARAAGRPLGGPSSPPPVATTKEWDASLLDLTSVPQQQADAPVLRANTKEWDSSLLDLTCVPQAPTAIYDDDWGQMVPTAPTARDDRNSPVTRDGSSAQPPSSYQGTASAVPTPAEIMRALAPGEEPATHDQAMEDYWRQEVASRVENFRQRRRRPRRERSLPLDFEATWPRATQPSSPARQDDGGRTASPGPLERNSAVLTTACVAEEHDDHVAQPPFGVLEDHVGTAALGRPVERSSPALEAPPRETNVIEFPRLPLVVPPSVEELAEPMLDTPRILDAPEAVDTCNAPLADISLGPPEDSGPPTYVPELPLLVAPVSQRAFALLVDALIVLLATGVFVMLVLKTSAQIPSTRGGFALLLGLPCFFWAIYQYLFLVHNGLTAGMHLARLGLTTFDGDAVPRSLRRWRAFAMVLSTVSLGLGLLWSLADEDTLCWHDRITRTYPVWLPQTSGYYKT